MDYELIYAFSRLQESNLAGDVTLTKENWEKLKSQLTSIINDLETALSKIEERNKLSKQIDQLKKMEATASNLLERLNDPIICKEIGVVQSKNINNNNTEGNSHEL